MPRHPDERPQAVLIIEPRSETRLKDARRWLRQLMSTNDFTCELVLTELLTNALEHGGGGHVRVKATVGPDVVDVEVQNAVPEQTVLPDPKAWLPNSASTRGRGLRLIDQLADIDWTSRNGWISVRARIPFSP